MAKIEFTNQDKALLHALGFTIDANARWAMAEGKVKISVSPLRHGGDFELTITLPDGEEITGNMEVIRILVEGEYEDEPSEACRAKMQTVSDWIRAYHPRWRDTSPAALKPEEGKP